MRFCQNCGTALPAAPAAQVPVAPGPAWSGTSAVPAGVPTLGENGDHPVDAATVPVGDAAPSASLDGERPAPAEGAVEREPGTIAPVDAVPATAAPLAAASDSAASIVTDVPVDPPTIDPTAVIGTPPAAATPGERHCTACGALIQEGAAFCAFCGRPYAQES
jgi:hypothetical protein